MAEFSQQSSLVKKLGARIAEAFEQHKDAPVQTGNQRLPEGIENGIALLRTMEFAEHKDGENRGKTYFRAAGVVEIPEEVEVNGVKIRVAGLQTSLIIPMYDTPNRSTDKTFADHWRRYLNLFKQFGVGMPPGQQPGESKEACSARIEQYFLTAGNMLCNAVNPQTGVKGTPFLFRTWKGKKQTTGPYANREPNVQEEWQGACEYTPAYNPLTDGVNVNGNGHKSPATPVITAPSPTPPSHIPTPARFEEPPMGRVDPQSIPQQPQPIQQPLPVSQPQPAPVAAQQSQLTQEQLLLLGEQGDIDPDGVTDEGSFAINTLTNEFRAAGITDEQVGQIQGEDGWQQVARMIIARRWPAAQPVAAPVRQPSGGIPTTIVKGGFLLYKGQRCEVTSVNVDARTVTLKGPDGKTVVGPDKRLLKVPFAECADVPA